MVLCFLLLLVSLVGCNLSMRPAKTRISPGIRPVCSVFAVRMKKAWVLSYPLSTQRGLRSEWTDAQADLSLRWAHSHNVVFFVRRLICVCSSVTVCYWHHLDVRARCVCCFQHLDAEFPMDHRSDYSDITTAVVVSRSGPKSLPVHRYIVRPQLLTSPGLGEKNHDR